MVDFLRERPEQRFKAREIAEWVFENHPEACQKKKAKSAAIETDTQLIQQLVSEIGAQRPTYQKRYSQIKTTEGRPRLYYWSERTDEAEVREAELDSTPSVAQAELTPTSSIATAPEVKLSEHDLYPMLSIYLRDEHDIFAKRIDERKSSNNQGAGGNKWLYPDLVGMEDLTKGWHDEIKKVVKEYADKKTKLWSFEVKLLLNRSNVREAFFQAVSNSSWANFGYLVAAEIEGTDTMRELRMLFALHGIGFIKLDTENPAESQILIPARERPEIDWATCDRLTKQNSDFKQYVTQIREFYQTGNLKAREWEAPKVTR